MKPDGGASGVEDRAEQGPLVARLEIVEHLRATEHVRGAVVEFQVDDLECLVAFKAPGYSVDVLINRENGAYQLSESYQGFVAFLNDLHKGRHTGRSWSLVIDVSAALMTFVSLTGLTLILYLKRRLLPGLITALVGALLIVLMVWLLVP